MNLHNIWKRLRSLAAKTKEYVYENKKDLVVLAVFLAGVVLAGVTIRHINGTRFETFTEPAFQQALEAGEITDVKIRPDSHEIFGEGEDDEGRYRFEYKYLEAAEGRIVDQLRQHAPEYEVLGAKKSVGNAIGQIVIIGLMAALVVGLLRRNGPFATTEINPVGGDQGGSGFSELGGLDEAIVEIQEVVEYLTDPARFQRLGAKPPRGVLLEGPPGTGKTALARAAAAAAQVPFYAVSASEFVEMYVGVGARRVRELFKKARQAGKAVIFIDEIDAVGRSRGTGNHNSNEERENTLNQLLVEMDGFTQSGATVVVIAATNRSDMLDPALKRRLPRHIHVGLPDRAGREQILTIHLGKVSADSNIDISSLAARTIGFSGADLEKLVNEAAMYAARVGDDKIGETHLEVAFDRIVLGLERRSAVPTERERNIVAYHEAGHTLCAYIQEHADRPHKVSIVPRGQAGGVTHYTPQDGAFVTKKRALASLRAMMGGRAGEELLLGDDITSGASHDFAAASNLARQMVCQYGMGNIGPIYLGEHNQPSPERAAEIEADIARLLDEAMEDARRLIADNRDAMERLVAALLEEETLDAERIAEVIGQTHTAAA